MKKKKQVFQPDDRLFRKMMEDKEHLNTVVIYFLAIIERSPRAFMEELENIEFTTKAATMSTLEQLLEQGRQEGIEQGLEQGLEQGQMKEKTLNLLKLKLNFPALSSDQLSDLTGLPLELVDHFYSVLDSKNLMDTTSFIHEQLLNNIDLSEEEENTYQQLIARIVK